MVFERCERCLASEEEEWEEISHEILRQECTNEQIEMMIWNKAVVRSGRYKYRRQIPVEVVDWALVLTQ